MREKLVLEWRLQNVFAQDLERDYVRKSIAEYRIECISESATKVGIDDIYTIPRTTKGS